MVQRFEILHKWTNFNGNNEIPDWLTKAKTVLLPKNNDTRNPKNYRPIALQNIMLKLYTKCINYLLQQHREKIV